MKFFEAPFKIPGEFVTGISLWGRRHGVVGGAVGKDEPDVCDDLVHAVVMVVGEFGLDCEEVHRSPNHIRVARSLSVTTCHW